MYRSRKKDHKGRYYYVLRDTISGQDKYLAYLGAKGQIETREKLLRVATNVATRLGIDLIAAIRTLTDIDGLLPPRLAELLARGDPLPEGSPADQDRLYEYACEKFKELGKRTDDNAVQFVAVVRRALQGNRFPLLKWMMTHQYGEFEPQTEWRITDLRGLQKAKLLEAHLILIALPKVGLCSCGQLYVKKRSDFCSQRCQKNYSRPEFTDSGKSEEEFERVVYDFSDS